MNAVVTGANGFIGSCLCQTLAQRGHSVIGLVQDTPDNRQIPHPFSETRFFNLSDPTSMIGICRNADIVFHLAAIPRFQAGISAEHYQVVNVQGTELLLNDALQAKARRFVYVSSIEAAGPAQNSVPLSEETAPHPVNPYGVSKLQAERLVLKASCPGMATTVIRLPMIYGPGNYLNVPKLFKAVTRPVFPMVGDGKALMEFCYVGNAVHGILLAAEHEKAKGEVFFISEESRHLEAVVRAVARAMGHTPLILHIPVPIAYGIACCFEVAAKLLPFYPFKAKITDKPYFSRDTVYWTTRSVNICSTAKAERLLGYGPVFSFDEGIRITVVDFRRRGWVS